ncbi:MAG TPA: hypothetical protein VGL20_18350 [Candidatus Dormibacteraeota bacterium]
MTLVRDLAFGRSGDKGDTANVGLLAKDEAAWQRLRRGLTPELVRAHLGGIVRGEIEIFEMPRIQALNVVLHNALGGGASRTLRFDQTGKAFATILLGIELPGGTAVGDEGADGPGEAPSIPRGGAESER